MKADGKPSFSAKKWDFSSVLDKKNRAIMKISAASFFRSAALVETIRELLWGFIENCFRFVLVFFYFAHLDLS